MADAARASHDRTALAALQEQRLRSLMTDVLPRTPFYAEKFGPGLGGGGAPRDVLSRLPFTTKAELLAEQAAHPPYGRLLARPRSAYSRLHQTSGTSGTPLRWLDTPESWQAHLDAWDVMFDMAGVGPADRFFFPFSFGPFLGFWTAFDAAARRGLLCLPGGGMSSLARLRFLADHEATVVCCTPTYALHLAEVARAERVDIGGSAVRLIVVAGEPGGNIPETRAAIEAAWRARVVDHCGMTEVGPTGIECAEAGGSLHLIESHYLAEVVDPGTGRPVPPGETGELVLTTLCRTASPLVRYKTGDLVRAAPEPVCRCGRCFVRLEGGILGRTDDMIHVRGNNVYPAALESILRRFAEIAEFRVEVDQTGPLAELRVEVEPAAGVAVDPGLARRVAQAVRDELLFRPEVSVVSPGTLPRFEMKARRVTKK